MHTAGLMYRQEIWANAHEKRERL